MLKLKEENQIDSGELIEGVVGPVEEAREQIMVLDEDDYDDLPEALKKKWKGYNYKMTYQVVTPESAEEGDFADHGWVEKKSDTYNSLEELMSDVDDHSWLEWSSSHPDGKRDWIISDSEQDFRTGERTSYSL